MNLNPLPDWAFGVLFIPAFAIFWCVISYVIAVVGGWRQLSRRYRRSTAIAGTTWRSQSAELRHYRGSSYNRCLNVVANEDGLGLSVLFPFRFGHPPLFIPWSEILVSQVKRLLVFNRIRFTLPEEPSVWIELSPKLAGKIQKAIGHDWFEEAE